jgi:hypothetical protein
MKGRKQKTPKDVGDSRQKVGAEHRGYAGMPTSIWINENKEVTPPQEDGLLGKILNPYNLNKAYLRFVRNKGSYGVDKMEIGVLRDYLNNFVAESIKERILRKTGHRP